MVVGAAVVKFQVKSAAMELADVSFAAVVIVALYRIPGERFAEGVNVAVLPVTFTVPVTATPPADLVNWKLAVFSVELVMASENVADTCAPTATSVASLIGDVADTVGGVVSPATVEKVQL